MWRTKLFGSRSSAWSWAVEVGEVERFSTVVQKDFKLDQLWDMQPVGVLEVMRSRYWERVSSRAAEFWMCLDDGGMSVRWEWLLWRFERCSVRWSRLCEEGDSVGLSMGICLFSNPAKGVRMFCVKM